MLSIKLLQEKDKTTEYTFQVVVNSDNYWRSVDVLSKILDERNMDTLTIPEKKKLVLMELLIDALKYTPEYYEDVYKKLIGRLL